MLLRFDAMLNGASFSAIDPAVILRDIEEMEAQEDTEEAQRAIHPGTRLTYSQRRSLSVRLHYNIREYDPAARSAVMDKVAAWAGDGGWLVLSTRPNQRLYVRPSALPSMGSALKWTEDMEMTLTAYERPFFEARWPATAIISESGVLYLQGTVPAAYVEVDATNAGDGNLTEITFRCEQTMITLQGLSVPVGGHIKLYYTDTDILVIDADGRSALANRTAESHDDLIATPRKSNAIEVKADQPVSAVFTARGRFR